MTLNFIKLIILLGSLIVGSVSAQETVPDVVLEDLNKDYLTLGSVQVTRLDTDLLNQEVPTIVDERTMSVEQLPGMSKSFDGGIASIAQAIYISQGLVALGEGVYTLVQKGKANNTTNYAPVSVMPMIGKEYVDILETEDWKMPRRAKYVLAYKNLLGMEVVQFRYSVIYAYGGTYNGTGSYITAAQIIPERVSTSFGFSFSANMKVTGVQNHGSRENPVAGLLLTMQHTVETFLQAHLETQTYHITGRGALKRL